MGGSILGTEAIYDFLKFKIKKNIKFFNNLDKKIVPMKNLKSGNTLEISNFNLILMNKANINTENSLMQKKSIIDKKFYRRVKR